MERKESLDFEDLIEKLGGFGKFQVLVYGLVCLCSFYSGLFIVSPIFISKILPHRCVVPFCDSESSINAYDKRFLNFTIPWNEGKKAWDPCHMFSPNDLPVSSEGRIAHSQISVESSLSSSLTEYESSASFCSEDYFSLNETVACHEWVYDHSEFISTTQSEYNLTCDDEWMLPLEMSSIMAGYLVGSVLTGIISDKFGRNFGIIFSAFTLSCAGIAAAFTSNYYVFLALRFIGGIGSMGCYHVAFVSAIEYIGIKYRTFCGVFMNVPFSFGEATLGLLAYYIRSWRMLLIASSVPVTIVFSYYWIMPESVRWLVTKNKKTKALKILHRAANINGKDLPADVEEYLKNQDSSDQTFSEDRSVLDLMRSQIIRKRSLMLFYCWMVCSLMYYGLSMYVGSLSGNLFLNFTLVILVEIPAYTISAFASNIFGRKLILFIFFIVGGFACIIAGFLSAEYHTLILTLSIIGKFGITGAFGAIYLYSGEIYPTEYRALGVGLCSMHGRIGGIIAPFIANLAQIYKPLPSLIFGILSFFAGLLLILLPETKGEDLPQTIKDSELIGKNQSTWGFCRCWSDKQR